MSESAEDPDAKRAFAVDSVGGHQPRRLEDFVGATTVSLRAGDHEVSLVGTGVEDDRTVQFSEKELASAEDGSATWRITSAHRDRFLAERFDHD